MIRTIARVWRGEGFASAARRGEERIADALHDRLLRARASFTTSARAEILNVSYAPIATRLGGVQVQLASRLREERAMRTVALLHPRGLTISSPRLHTRDVQSIAQALEITGAQIVHVENTDAVDVDELLRLAGAGARVILSVHDFSLFCRRPHLIEQPMQRFCFYSTDLDRCARCLGSTPSSQSTYRASRHALLTAATHVIFPSQFLLDQHRALFSLPLLNASVIAPGVRPFTAPRSSSPRNAIAYVGALKIHKGAHLLPDLIRDDEEWHIFGGGDEELLRPLRARRNVHIHGYYRDGQLPALLARHRVGLVVLPSIWPETFGLVLSEAWLAVASVAAFDLGAIADRIRNAHGRLLTPLDRGASGLRALIDDWKSGAIVAVAPHVPTPRDAALAHVALYAAAADARSARN